MSKKSSTEKSELKVRRYLLFAHRKKLLFLPYLILISVVALGYLTNGYAIFPSSGRFKVNPQSDLSQPAGRSEVRDLAVTDTGVSFSYVLRHGYSYPYAGVGINLIDSSKNDSSGIDLSKYDELIIDFGSSTPKGDMKIYITSFIKGYTDMPRPMSWQVLEKTVPVSGDVEQQVHELKDFKTPNWWYDLNKLNYTEVPLQLFDNCLGLVIESGDYEQKGVAVDVIIKRIILRKDVTLFTIWMLVLTISYALFHIYIRKVFLRVKDGPVVISYNELPVSSYADEDATRIVDYVAQNYSNQELLVKDVSRTTGVTQAKIQTILKTKFKMSFRQYLNTIRTYEAKRLLRETDRQVTDIAYRVGYKNVTHFNRIFKESEAVSPNQYRKKCQDS